MTTLEDAWEWYQAARTSLQMLERLAGRYWDDLPWDSRLGRDHRFRDADGADVQRQTQTGQKPLDDLAVLVLFSVFESTVREVVQKQVESEVDLLRHPALRKAAMDTIGAIEDGSFFRVLEPFKLQDHDLVEDVNKIRRYRNWVAHGRRGAPPGSPPFFVEPRMAFDRLSRFLALIQPQARPGAGST